MDIVDAQLHIGPGMIDTILEAMDSLGIRSAVIDEYWLPQTSRQIIMPGYRMANGALRARYPVAEQASILHPERFAFLVRIDRRDPELASVMRVVAASPHARAFRLLPVATLDEARILIDGGYDPVFELAQDIGLPVCLFTPGYVEHLAPYLRRFPRLQFVVDHCGMGMSHHPPDRPEAEVSRTRDGDYFDEVLTLAEHPNVALKWSQVPRAWAGATAFPYKAARPFLRRAIEAFGAERLVWASDKTVIFGHSWSNLLDYLRYDPELSADEKAWILGRTARRVFNWPAG
jgi:L-fuconolactonase